MLRRIVKKSPLLHGVARRSLSVLSRPHHPSASSLPSWLKKEWQALHEIDKELFPSPAIPHFDTLTPDHKMVGSAYKALIDSLRFDTYDYLIFAPWLVQGGADLFVVNYANTIAHQQPNKRVLVVATLPSTSPWKNKLDDIVDFLDFGTLTAHLTEAQRQTLLGHIIENGQINHLHIINSALGYDFVKRHRAYLRHTDRKVVATSFSQSIDDTGRVFGYSHTHTPKIYEETDVITSDNQTVLTMWEKEYGFDPRKMTVHHQPITIPAARTARKRGKTLRILWAARLAPEKQPEIVVEIARLCEKENIHIDLYGHVYEDYNTDFLSDLPANIEYKGPFEGPESIPYETYDLYLYTSLFDGMPNTLLEMASVRLPIITSNVGGISEFVHHLDTGYLVEDIRNPEAYATAIKQVIKGPGLLVTWSDNAFARLEKDFSAKAFETSVRKLLKDIGY